MFYGHVGPLTGYHAWTEAGGKVYDTGDVIDKDVWYRAMAPVRKEVGLTWEQAALLLARNRKHGPYAEEELADLATTRAGAAQRFRERGTKMLTEYAGSFVNPADLDPTRYVTMWKQVGSEWVMVRSFSFRYLDENYFHGAMETKADDGRTLRWFEQGVNPNDDYTVAGAGFSERGTKMTTKKFGAYEAGKQYGFDYWHTPVFPGGPGSAFPTGPDRDTAWAEYAAKNLAGVHPSVQSSMKAEFFTGYFSGRQKYNDLTAQKKRRVSPTSRPPNRVDRSLLPKMREQGDKKFGAKVFPHEVEQLAKAKEWDDGYSAGYDRGKKPPRTTAAQALKQYEAEGHASSPLGRGWIDGFYVGYYEAGAHYYGGTELPNSLTVVDNVLSYARHSERTGNRMKKFGDEGDAFEMGEAWGVRIWAIITGMEFEGHRTPDFERRVNPDDQYGIEHQWAFFIRENPEARSWRGFQKSAWGRGYSTKVKGFSERTGHRTKKFAAGGMKVVSASGGPISVVGLDAAYGVTEIHPTPNDPAYLRGWPFDGKPASTPVAIEWYNDYYMAKAGDLSYVVDRSNYTQAERAAMSERTGHRFVAPRGLFG